jgi:hypothetical protein
MPISRPFTTTGPGDKRSPLLHALVAVTVLRLQTPTLSEKLRSQKGGRPDRAGLGPGPSTAYRLRNLIERAFCRRKTCRAIATGNGKLATSYAAASSSSSSPGDPIESRPSGR